MISLVFFKYLFVSGCTASNIVFWNAMSGLHRFDEGLFFKNAFVPFAFELF